MASCIQITLQHQSVSGFFDVPLSSLLRARFSPQISICSHLSPRLTALEKEARCVQNHTDRWTDRWSGCALLVPHYRLFRGTLYRCNDRDFRDAKSHRVSLDGNHTRSWVCLKQDSSRAETVYFRGVSIYTPITTAGAARNDAKPRNDSDWNRKR